MDKMLPFLRAIAENPDDDTSRLVFSDWLDDHDYCDRAEFIRLQVELARLDPSANGYAEKTAQMRRCGVFTRPGTIPFFDHLPTKECTIGFARGFISALDTANAATIDTSGFDLLPLQTLRTRIARIEQFRQFAHLKWLELHDSDYRGGDRTPARLLEILGPDGWFKHLEELSLPNLNRACLEAGVIPQFDLPRLRNFFLSTEAFYSLGVPVATVDSQDEDDYGNRPWGGLPEYLPRNALPNRKTALERFAWHSDDDCDFFNDEDWYWRGPSMESLLAHLKPYNLKQIEVIVDYDDHENGAEGVIAAPYQQNPLALSTTLERVTLDGEVRLLEGSARPLKALRIYDYGFNEELFALLTQPVCSGLEALHLEARGGDWGGESAGGASISLPRLRSLRLDGVSCGRFANCQFPNLISLLGYPELAWLRQRQWPQLQHLALGVNVDTVPELMAFAQSDCCPNLTTLTLSGYFYQNMPDFSFLARCPHMPFLSLVHLPGGTYIVTGGRLVPVRGDVQLDDWMPSLSYRIHAVF